MESISILIVEDDLALANELREYLEKWEYQISLICEFSNVWKECIELGPDLILMDINLPFYDGFYWCQKIREYSKVPMIFISSRNSDQDKIMAIAQGGDDYIEKPFNLSLLKAKIQAILRRTYQYKVSQKQFIHENIYYDLSSGSVYYGQEKIELTKSENTIVQLLMEDKSKIVSRIVLMDELWNTDEFISDNTLTVLISRLRTKFKQYTGNDIIYTKKGQGYYIK